MKIVALLREIDIDEYRDFASRKSIFRLDFTARILVARSLEPCMFTQSLPLFIALVLERIEAGIISVNLGLGALERTRRNDFCIYSRRLRQERNMFEVYFE